MIRMTPFELSLSHELDIERQRFGNDWLFKWYNTNTADGSGDCRAGTGAGIERPNDGALIALAFVFLGLIGQFELAAVVDGVQTFEWQGRS